MIKISFNGEVREFAAEGKSYIELISSVDPKLLSSYVAAKLGDEVVDLRDIPADGAEVELVGLDSKEALTVLRHTTTHIMAEAVNTFSQRLRLLSVLLQRPVSSMTSSALLLQRRTLMLLKRR